MRATSSIFAGNDAGGADPASCAEDTTPPSLGDIALFIGGIAGEYADAFVKLNTQNIWTRPLPHSTNGKAKMPEPWRGKMPADIPLDGPILCHSFRRLPRRSSGWHHGAVSGTTTSSPEKPREVPYPLNEKSGISSSTLRVDYTTGPNRKLAPRVTPLSRESPFTVCMGRHKLKLFKGHEGVVLDRPAQIYFAGVRFSYWVWVPTLNRAEEKAFNAQVKAFIDRANRLDMDYFPGIESTGEGTHAPSPRGSTSPDDIREGRRGHLERRF
ncbi:hypothetical protein PGQ11_002979 [Apiospora arundinis]|uniref:Uncharacterized protein n=1 Tax=Apiospora arundinis TaxID=335852 RepID=A0ABR2J3S4_9PEZI